MPDRFPMTPSQIPEGDYIVAVCKVCGGSRYMTRALMIEKAGDIPLDRIEPRVRCVERPRSNKRGPACGGAMEFEWGPVRSAPEAQASTIEQAREVAAFAEKMGAGRATGKPS